MSLDDDSFVLFCSSQTRQPPEAPVHPSLMDVSTWVDQLTPDAAPRRASKASLKTRLSIATLGSYNSSEEAEETTARLTFRDRMQQMQYGGGPVQTGHPPAHGRLLNGSTNPYELSGIGNGKGHRGKMPPVAPQAPRESMVPVRRADARQMSTICYNEDQALARLEGRSCFGHVPSMSDESAAGVNFGVPVPGGVKPNYSESSVPKRSNSLLRCLSQKVKKITTRRSTSERASISGPVGFKDLAPNHSRPNTLHAELKAIDIGEAQRRQLRATMHAEIAVPGDNFRSYQASRGHPAFHTSRPAAPVAQPSMPRGQVAKSTHPADPAFKTGPQKPSHPLRRKPAPLPPRKDLPPPTPPREVYVVGADRETRWGDFVDFNPKDHVILDIKPLRPKRKPVPARQPNTNFSFTAQNSPAIIELCNRVDECIAETARPSMQGTGERIVDTYVQQNGRARWMVNGQEVDDAGDGRCRDTLDDEAAVLMERLRMLRMGE